MVSLNTLMLPWPFRALKATLSISWFDRSTLTGCERPVRADQYLSPDQFDMKLNMVLNMVAWNVSDITVYQIG
jgi:hypothetical protein